MTRDPRNDLLTAFAPLGATSPASELETKLEELHERGRARWPGVTVSLAAFATFLAERVDSGTVEALAALHAEDLYLVCACLADEQPAFTELIARIDREVRHTVARLSLPTAEAEDLRQGVEERLLVSDEKKRLAEYRGHGPLSSWLRAIAARDALKLAKREQRNEQDEGDALVNNVAPSDPELELIRRRHGEDFQRAFEEALKSLTPRERMLLKMQIVDGLSIDEVGVFFRAHRATAAKWIAEARAALVERTRRTLQSRLGLSTASLDSLVHAFKDALDVSVRRLLTAAF